MCGIAGIFGQSNFEAVQAMLRATEHRGPDDQGIYVDEAVTLGHRRLSIIDTSATGHQPMGASEGRIQIVYNGELYNTEERRQALRGLGREFKGSSDTEVILALYERYGVGCLKLLRGIFSFAIYDRRQGPGRETMLLARDPFGIKPLLYHKTHKAIVFASELKGLLASGLIPREVDPVSVRQLLSLGSVYQSRTMVKDVESLPSGHYMVVDRAGIHIERYWTFAHDRVPNLRRQPYPMQVEALKWALSDSVKRQMVADVPVGAFLSGGVDSSLIVALMSAATNRQIKTFSVGFESDAQVVDESHEAAETAAFLGTDHTRVMVGTNEIVDHLMRFIRGIDQPSVDGLNSYFVSHATAQHVTVALSGTGSDEVFLGYPWFARMAHRFGSAPLPPEQTPEYLQAFGGQYHLLGPEAATRYLSEDFRNQSVEQSFSADLALNDDLSGGGTLDRAGVLCLNGYTRNQLLRDIDACSMAHSLEVRVPFLDPVVVDIALSLPQESKIAMTERTLDVDASYDESGVKRIVCDVARDYLPPSFFNKRAKKGFALPFADWLKGPLAEVVQDTLSAQTVRSSGMFDPTGASEIYNDFQHGLRPWSHPWTLMISELWSREVLNA
ncbi:asparagine synthase (glutamine-hydrolyzing) [Methylobacterium sp. J-077]|uniref:asparagine synthase (glutamine-hydrolyzing) n=1 Tax=Methylobacterium sp. J-077 TaxID=2836656 RepID=UPI001FBBF415|nr:asparagine synthase (glutamine-hydrolyzing) [Methylobacterium sp. J-077]MCJ2126403.1 asparagine synthase (glutamine-hydrolyzing) [Methylobacterium sp. J-077]